MKFPGDDDDPPQAEAATAVVIRNVRSGFMRSLLVGSFEEDASRDGRQIRTRVRRFSTPLLVARV